MRALFSLLFFFTFQAGAEFKVPALTGPVMDEAGMLTLQTRSELEELIRAVRNAGGSQLQVLIVPNLDGTSVEEAAIKTFDQYQLGGKKTDDGILLLISKEDRKLRIEVGQGREGDLPDVIAKRIISDVMIPHFKAGDVDRGVKAGVIYIFKYADPDALSKVSEYGREVVPKRHRRDHSVLFFIGLFLMIIFFRSLSPWWLLGSLGGSRGWGRSSGWGGGGFGGGGWGGGWSGGGGSSSGGGASGSW